MNYTFSFENPASQFIDIEFTTTVNNRESINIQLPAWRPGRYELGNFAKNVRCFTVHDENGNFLSFTKENKDKWTIASKGATKIKVKYQYYASDLNAGSTYLSLEQLYVNPVNCCVYDPEKINEKCFINIHTPSNFIFANSMKVSDEKIYADNKITSLEASNFHDLADSPFIASPTLLREYFVVDGTEFNLWFQGECKPTMSKIIGDFFIFINEQLVMFKSIETEVFHFMFQILPYHFYHGVEHKNSTVIALGPTYNLMKKDVYNELLGVSCHELFHHWNIKTIRPLEMQPYDYTKENYSYLGYVCEGVTTYYGDYLLYRSGVFSDDEYFNCFNEQLKKHFDNFGRYNLSVADSSFDTWLDGYTKGIPDRKVSIYTEGCLIAFITDINIRKATNNERNLDFVMRYLYENFGKQNKGYTDHDYRKIVNDTAGISLDWIFDKHIYNNESLVQPLKDALEYIGLELSITSNRNIYEAILGFKVVNEAGRLIVSSIYPDSEADKNGLMLNDRILSVNSFEVKQDLNEWITYFLHKDINIEVISQGKIRQIKFKKGKDIYYKNYNVIKQYGATDTQQLNFKNWSGRYY
jgi:predicted metalloprotease with PDZ domain